MLGTLRNVKPHLQGIEYVQNFCEPSEVTGVRVLNSFACGLISLQATLLVNRVLEKLILNKHFS